MKSKFPCFKCGNDGWVETSGGFECRTCYLKHRNPAMLRFEQQIISKDKNSGRKKFTTN